MLDAVPPDSTPSASFFRSEFDATIALSPSQWQSREGQLLQQLIDKYIEQPPIAYTLASYVRDPSRLQASVLIRKVHSGISVAKSEALPKSKRRRWMCELERRVSRIIQVGSYNKREVLDLLEQCIDSSVW
jgi:hypothetical protein